ncbi:aldolase [Alsobacter soli]|uniref:Aldolase n=1 Tax=Alsobacter soli TaxID=2109933 RepID=A0A2T1HX29_9HYPH|nr:class II aldolase/adducin family protein [Alsobacter soli]PSC06069.1 aldolase [Alsobacter soli]
MKDAVARALDDLVAANHILAAENILDGFGHLSVRHPGNPDAFLITTVRAAELVSGEDIVELDLAGAPHTGEQRRLFAERILHAAVYRLRPDVNAVCHHHAPAVLPFCITGEPLVPVVHLGATMGTTVPFWDSREEFGDTDLLIRTEAQGLSMASALGPHWTLLIRNHGATVVGRSVRECVFRTLYGAHNAAMQMQARQLGPLRPLTRREAELAGDFNLTPIAVDRSWDRWRQRASA